MAHLIPQPWRHELRRRQRLWQLRRLQSGSGAGAHSDDPVTVYGLFSSASGLGQAVRLLADNLEQIGRTVHRIDVTAHLHGTGPAQTPVATTSLTRDPGWGPIIWHLNPVEAAEVMVALPPPCLAERPRIGMWLYELNAAPARWRSYVPLFHAIWSPSDASAAAMKSLGADAVTVPYCHTDICDVHAARADTSPPVFTVLAMADARSSLARKNIAGAIAAFRCAFDQTDQQVRLRVKVSHLPDDAPLRDAIRACPQAELIESRLSFRSTLSLMAEADTFLSLHRGEGYGLTLVESMQMGVPVIMTDEPSTRALQLAGSSWTTPSHTVPVRDPQAIYRSGHWAEPDLTVAAKHLTKLRQDWRSGALATGREGRIRSAAHIFSGPARLDGLRAALAALPQTIAPQAELRRVAMREASAT
ncbi:glycosyltransferase [Algimonas porphyrae]|uniref:Glycosyltransferase family 4 protein n=1 Tax=Algimonas porphyrae TaxID=1128113 RepID=A0ABQ5V090_9PROT|nr:glycosyltransferase [Algimonas porphyrae]GLQ20833.1 hypothetical protein GCM10007854_17880 [Algimonas porphyrae]